MPVPGHPSEYPRARAFRHPRDAFAACACLWFSMFAHATFAAAWINPAGGAWNEPTNWSGGIVPLEGEVTISLAGAYTITNQSDLTLGRLVLDNPDAVLAGPGSLRITNLFEWRAGSLGAPSTAVVTAEGGLSLGGTNPNPRRLLRTLVNQGEATWSADAPLQLGAGAIFSNAPSGVFRILGQGRLEDGEGKGLLANAGLLRKEGAGDMFVPTTLRNSGLLEIAAGTMQMARGFEQNGELRIANGARLSLVGGTHVFAPSSVLKGAGELKVTGGSTTLDGIVELTGPQLFQGGTIQLNGQRLGITNQVLVSSGQVNFGGTYTFISNLVSVVGGTANFVGHGTLAPASLVITNLGILGGDQSMEVSDLVQLGVGTMQGSGSVLSRGELQLATGNFTILGRSLVNQGTARWIFPTPGGTIGIAQGGAITNLVGATFDLAFDGNLVDGGRAIGFVNAGTFRKSAGTGLANFTAPFHNQGLVQVEAGTLNLSGGGSHSGSVVITNLAQFTLGNGTHSWSPESSISGPGNFRVNGGVANLAGAVDVTGAHIFSGGTANLTGRYNAFTNPVAVVGGTANFLGHGTLAPASLVISNLGILGGDQSMEVSDLVQLGVGTMQGSGSVLSRGELQLATGNFTILGRSLVNQGTARWIFPTPGGTIGIAQGGAITNLVGATFDLAFDGNLVDGGRAIGFVNAGTFRKSAGTGLANFTAPFHNQGLVQVEAGTLNLSGGGSHSGSVVITNLAQFTLGNGTHSWGQESSISGPGIFRVNGGVANLAGAVDVTGTHIFSGGTANLTGRYNAFTNPVAVVGGTANFLGHGTLAPASLVISNLGILGGDQSMEVSDLVQLGVGTMQGSGSVLSRGELQLATGNFTILGRSLVNQGNARWIFPSPGGTIGIAQGGAITNLVGATFDLAFDGNLVDGGRAGGFVNLGSFRKSAGTGLANFTAPLQNRGILDVLSGALQLSGKGDHSGAVRIAEGSQLILANGTHDWGTASSISGPGRFRVNGGTANFAGTFTNLVAVIAGGTANFLGDGTLAPSSLVISNLGILGGHQSLEISDLVQLGSGRMQGSGSVISRGELQLATGNFTILGRSLVNQGNARWIFPSPGGAISVSQGATISNLLGATFDLAFDGNLVDGGRAGGFINLGTFRKSAGTALANFTAPLQNRGVLEVLSGTLQLSGKGDHSGAVRIAEGSQLILANGTHDWGTASSISGPGHFRVNGGTANLAGAITNLVAIIAGGTANFLGDGTLAPSSLVISNLGILGGHQSLEVPELLQLGVGTLQGSGSVVSRGQLQLATGNFTIIGRSLVNQGNARWIFPSPGGAISVSQGATISNLLGATFDLAFDGNLVDGGRAGGFINLGAFRKSDGTGLANFTAPFLNQGLLQVEAGTLQFQGAFTQSSGKCVLAGGQISSGGTLQFTGGSLTGSGRITGSVSNAATVVPGDLRGGLEIIGDYGQSENGRLEILLGSQPLSPAPSPLVISNTAVLHGTVAIALTNTFVPPTNAVFEVLRHRARSGTFRQFLYPSNEIGMSLEYTASNVAVRVTNVRPIIAPLANQTVEAGQTLRVAVRASDADLPAQALTYALAPAPVGMEISAAGVISWTPTAIDVGVTTNLTVTVTDNGTPNLSATASFRVTVGGSSPVTAVAIQPGVPATGQCTLQFRGTAGTRYVTEYALSVMGPWVELETTVADARGTWQVVDGQATSAARFYRVR